MSTNSNRMKSSSKNSSKQPTSSEIRNWYEQHKNTIERFERSQEALQLVDPKKTNSKTFSIYSKENLRTYMKNPFTNARNLRNLSRFLYYRSQIYRRIVNYNADMINLNYRTVTPLIDLVKGGDSKKVLNNYYDTLVILEKMNLPLEFLKAYITCWIEDVFYGCVYYDDEGMFILPLDPDYCKITGVYKTGDFAFDMDMSFFNSKEDILEMWGDPFKSMYADYQRDAVNGRWQPMPDENCICLKININDWETALPPYMALFDSLINLEDLKEITAIADEQQIYKLLVATMPLVNNSDEVDDFAVDPKTAVDYFNKMVERLPNYTNAALSPIPITPINFEKDSTTDVNKVEKTTQAVLQSSGGVHTLGSQISGSTAWLGAIKADEDFAMSALLPQTQAWMNRFLKYQLKEPAKVRFLEVSKYTITEYKNNITKDGTYGLPVKLLINVLNGISELETLSMAFLENEVLELHDMFIPLRSSNSMNTGDLSTKPTAEDKGEIPSSEAEDSRDKRDRNN